MMHGGWVSPPNRFWFQPEKVLQISVVVAAAPE